MKDYVNRLKVLLVRMLHIGQPVESGDNQSQLLDLIRKAHREWEIAVNNFNHCVDLDMIDYSIYNMEAAERRYVCLLKMAKKENMEVKMTD